MDHNSGNLLARAAEQARLWRSGVAGTAQERAEAQGLEGRPFAGAIAVEAATDLSVDTSAVKESLLGQFDTAFSGYETVAELINDGLRTKEQFKVADLKTAEAELLPWLTELSDESARYMARRMEADPEVFWTLIATPNNAEVTSDEAESLAKAFGEDQPHPSYIWRPILERYKASELSGTSPNNKNSNMLRFAAVPSKPTPELYGTVDEQRYAFANLRAGVPNLRVASLLDALVHAYTLRAGSDDLAHGDVSERTYNRHFDLPRQHFNGDFYYVVESSVGGDGRLHVRHSYVPHERNGRALVV